MAAAGGVNGADRVETGRGRARPREPSSGEPLPRRKGSRMRSQVYGAAVLLATTVLWASGGPTTKYLFLLPNPPTAALLTACIAVVTALFLGVGLLGTAMEAGSSRRGGSLAAATAAAAADGGAAAGRERRPTDDTDEDEEAEAEALLHSGMHATGGAGGGALAAAAAAAAREAAQEHERQRAWEREQVWARAHECALPLLPSHGSQPYYSMMTTNSGFHSRVHSEPAAEPGTAAAEPGLSSSLDAGRTPLWLALGAESSGRDSGGGGGAGGQPARRGPSLDGTSAGLPSLASPPPRLRPYTGADSVRLSGGGPSTSAGGAGAARHRSTGGGGAGGARRWRLRLLTAPARSLLAAGLELGIYNVTAAALGAWGMQRISATRSAFLAQATSLLTPLLVWLSGGRVGPVVWTACCCGALGGAMVALDNVYGAATAAADTAAAGPSRQLLGLLAAANADPIAAAASGGAGGGSFATARTLLSGEAAVRAVGAGSSSSGGGGSDRWQVEGVLLSRQTMGAAYVLLSCVFWGLGTVRLGVHSARFPPLNLAAAAAVCYAGLSLLWLLVEVVGSSSAALTDFLELGLLLRNHVTAALLLWAGLGPGALSSYLQVLGQQTVPPAQAQVLFSSTPLWSALIAQLLLPGEAMGPLAWAGGAVMLGASLLASLWQ